VLAAKESPQLEEALNERTGLADEPLILEPGHGQQRQSRAFLPCTVQTLLVIEEHCGDSMPVGAEPAGLIQQDALRPANRHLRSKQQD